MEARPDSGFTLRIRKACAQAAPFLPAQSTSRMLLLLDRSGGDFVPTARRLLEGPLLPSLIILANANALHLSLEWIILNEPEWLPLFGARDREIARLRLDEARRLAAEGAEGP